MRRTALYLLFLNISMFAQAPVIQWQNRIGGSGWDNSYASQNSPDGGFIIGGRSDSNISGDKTENSRGRFDYWIVKTDSSGIINWDKTIGGASPTGAEQDELYDLQQAPDGGYVICGASESPISGDKTEDAIDNSPDFWIVKTNAFGSIEWQNVIGGNSDDVPAVMENTLDGGYIVGGYSESGISADKTEPSRGSLDFWVVKLDDDGNIVWQKTLGGSGIDYLTTIVETPDNGFLLGGNSNSDISGDKTENTKGGIDFWIVKLDATGNMQWQKTIGGSGYDSLSKIIPVLGNNYFLAGTSNSPVSGDKTESCRGSYDYWVMEIDSAGNILWQKTLGGDSDDELFSAAQCTDGNYILSGTSLSIVSGDKTEPLYSEDYDGWVIKIGQTGNILWQKDLGGSGSDGFNVVTQTSDGGYFLSGGTNSPISGDVTEAPMGENDYWILKLGPDNLSTVQNELSQIILYPNPFSGTIIINLPMAEAVKIEVFNMLGQPIKTENYFSSRNITLMIDGASGVYFIRLIYGEGLIKTFKVVKQ